MLDFVILLLLSKIEKKQKEVFNLFLAACLSGIAVISPYIFPFSLPYKAVLFFDYAVMPFLVVKVAFWGSRWREYFRLTLFYWGLSFFTGGVLQFFYNRFPLLQENSYPMLTLFGTVLFAVMFFGKAMEMIKKHLLERKLYFTVTIQIGEKSIKTTGLMDTGNQLREPVSQKPVILMEKQLLDKEKITLPETNFYIIPFHSIGKKRGILRGFVAERIRIESENGEKVVNQVMIGICEEALSMKGEYSLILNPML